MKKIISILVSVCLLLMVSAPLFALDVVSTKNVAVYNEVGEWQKISVYDGLEKAVKYAKDGDTIEVFNDIELNSQITINKNLTIVSGTPNEALTNENSSSINKHGTDTWIIRDENATAKTVTQKFDGSAFIVEKGGVLNINKVNLVGKSENTAEAGGLVYVQKGGEMNAFGTTTFKGSTLAGESTKGGAIYMEGGAKVYIGSDVQFDENTATEGNDIYAVEESNLFVSGGTYPDIAYGEGYKVMLGDLNYDEVVDDKDAIYLLFSVYFENEYPQNQYCNFNHKVSGTGVDDAVYLLYHVYFPQYYPIYEAT